MLFAAGGVRAEPADIGVLQAERGRLLGAEDSLRSERGRLVAEVERLAARIDSLKGARDGATASGALQQALRRSLGLAGQLEEVDRGLEKGWAELKAVGLRLREAYGREIGRLIGQLGKAPDEMLIRRLSALQEARDALDREAAAERDRPGAELLSIREGDGPDEIRQKADLMEDMAAHLRDEAGEVDRRLERLGEERRLRARLSSFTREMALFDENLPEGRVLSAETGEKVAASEEEAKVGPPTLGGAEESFAPGDAGMKDDGLLPAIPDRAPSGVEAETGIGLVAGREAAQEGERALPEDLGADDLVHEIERVKARRKALLAQERALMEQVAAFRKRIEQMLEERR